MKAGIVASVFVLVAAWSLPPSSALARGKPATPSNAQVDDLVRCSYQYVAMYNGNNKFALKQGGWNRHAAEVEPTRKS